MISRKILVKYYLEKKLSAKDIAKTLKCSENKINYWLKFHKIPKRTLSESQYLKHNPKGDPYKFCSPDSNYSWFLYGLGLGLWWGEGNKVSKTAIRLGNTDPDLLKVFLVFLKEIYQIDESRLRFGLQLFSDIDEGEAKKFWCDKLNIGNDKFQKVIVSKSISSGTYKKKTQYGVLTIYFSNTKIRDNIYDAIQMLKTDSIANVAQSVERIHGGSQ